MYNYDLTVPFFFVSLVLFIFPNENNLKGKVIVVNYDDPL